MSVLQLPGRISRSEHLPLHKPSGQPPITPPLRKPRQQATLLAVLAFILLIIYVFFLHHQAGLGSQIVPDSETSARHNQLSFTLESIHKHGVPRMRKTAAEQIHLTDKQELAAVSSFLTSLSSQNHIPLFVDPSNPIDPQLILDFDTRAPRAAKEVQAMVDDVWSRNPVFLYSKHYSSASRDVKAILDKFHLKPSPTIIDVDTRDDADVLIPMLQRLTSVSDFPILIVAGEVIGSTRDVHRMIGDGTLRKMIAQSGALIGGGRRKKHKH